MIRLKKIITLKEEIRDVKVLDKYYNKVGEFLLFLFGKIKSLEIDVNM